jgi:PAS domain S-box-containing protein
MFKGLSLKIWLPFTLVLIIIAVSFNIYYPRKQEVFYVKNKNNELRELAKTVGLGVELSLSEDNFEGLKRTLDFASKRQDFEFIAIILNEGGKETVFTSYPALSENKILKKSEDFFYQKSPFQTDNLNGHILIAASKEKMANELTALNRPVYFWTVFLFFLTFTIYVLLAKRITRPLNELVRVTEGMGDEHFMKITNEEFSNDEIGQLGRSINELQEKLIVQRNRNKELYDGLEDQIKMRTKELAQVSENLIESQKIASIANYTMNIHTGKVYLPSLFFEILHIGVSDEIDLDVFTQMMFASDREIIGKIISDSSTDFTFTKEFRFNLVDNTIVWISMSGVKKIDADSNELIIRGLIQDITDRKNYENEINRLSLVAKNTSNCVIITDANRKIVWANESAQTITEYSIDEMIGNTPKMFQFDKTDPRTIEFIRTKIEANENINCEILNRSKYGKEYWLELNIVPLFNESNELYGYIAVETDITDIKNTSLELAERERQLTDILDNSAEMIHTLDEQGNVLWANRSWKENLKVTDANLRNRNILEFLDEPTVLEFEEIMPKLAKGEKIVDLNCGFYATDGDLIVLKGQAIPLFRDGKLVGSQAYLHNVTQVMKAEKELKSFSRMQNLLMEISFDFLNVEPLDTNDTISNAIGKLGSYINASQISVVNRTDAESILNQEMSFNDMNLYNSLDLETSASDNMDRSFVQKITLSRNNLSIGELQVEFTFDKKLSSNEIELLNLFAAMLVNVENRYLSAKEINQAKHEIELINSSLESKVLENTKRNLDLSKTIVEQEKMATIGEISAGIAHDLNTPLGAIKIGAESISYSLDSFLELFPRLDQEESKLLFSLSKKRKIDLILGGLQLMRESKEMNMYLAENYSIDTEKSQKLSDLLVKCRFDIKDSEEIKQIISLKNPEAFLEALSTLLTAHSMLSSVSDSVVRASDVVQNIRSFIKKDISTGNNRKDINLHDSVKVVLNIFNYEFKRNVDLSVDIDNTLFVKGFDVKLFQLWSNLIKNAIDAMENIQEKKLSIKGSEKDGKVIVSFSNNGPMIPEDIQQQIFKKFFSTKKDKNGTGLGLSIVQSVIHEHNAKIHLESTEALTTFTVEF